MRGGLQAKVEENRKMKREKCIRNKSRKASNRKKTATARKPATARRRHNKEQ